MKQDLNSCFFPSFPELEKSSLHTGLFPAFPQWQSGLENSALKLQMKLCGKEFNLIFLCGNLTELGLGGFAAGGQPAMGCQALCKRGALAAAVAHSCAILLTGFGNEMDPLKYLIGK